MAKEQADVAAAERALERLFRLNANRRAHDKQAAAVGADVTRAGYAILRCVEEADRLSLSEVANRSSMDPAAAGRQVRALEDGGLVERAPAADDGRVTVVQLTSSGRDMYRRITAVRTRHLTEVLAEWSPSDRLELARLLDRLVDDLKRVPFRPLRGA